MIKHTVIKNGLQATALATALTLGLAAVGANVAEARPRSSFNVWVGGPFWWGPYPYGYGYGYPYVVERPIIIQQAPVEPAAVAPNASQQANTWYYCRDAQMYYPYVTTCPSPWQEVPASPPPAPPAPAAQQEPQAAPHPPITRTAPAPVPPAAK